MDNIINLWRLENNIILYWLKYGLTIYKYTYMDVKEIQYLLCPSLVGRDAGSVTISSMSNPKYKIRKKEICGALAMVTV